MTNSLGSRKITRRLLSFQLGAAALLVATSASATTGSRIDVRCRANDAVDKMQIQFGYSRYTFDVWTDSVAYGPTLGERVQDVDVGQFMNDSGQVFLKIYTPDTTGADNGVSGFKLRLKGDGKGAFKGTFSNFSVSYDPRRETESHVRNVICKSK